MIDLIKAWFGLLGAIFSELLKQTEFGAVIAGTLCAVGVTQFVKVMVINSNLPNGPWRVWYLTTVVAGLSSTLLLWPTRLAIVWGLIVGTLFAPTLYICVTRALYLKWPDLRNKISATPQQPKAD